MHNGSHHGLPPPHGKPVPTESFRTLGKTIAVWLTLLPTAHFVVLPWLNFISFFLPLFPFSGELRASGVPA